MTPALPAGVRRARKEDIPAMAGLLGELFAIETEFPVRREKQVAGLEALLRSAGGRAVVAEADGAVAGMATMQILVSTAEGGPVGLVEDVIVHSPYRGRGLGAKLLSALESVARAEGLSRMQLLADERNASAASFYRGLGWSMTGMRSWRKFPGPC